MFTAAYLEFCENHFNRHLAKLIHKLENESSNRISYGRFNFLISFAFSKDEARLLLKLLQSRSIVRTNQKYIHLTFGSSAAEFMGD